MGLYTDGEPSDGSKILGYILLAGIVLAIAVNVIVWILKLFGIDIR